MLQIFALYYPYYPNYLIEFAHFYNTYGTKVTVIEAFPTILPVEDEDISKELMKNG